jgi:hypothetical protein
MEESRCSQCVSNQIQEITAAENAPRSAAWCVPHHGLRTYPASFTLKPLKIDHAETGQRAEIIRGPVDGIACCRGQPSSERMPHKKRSWRSQNPFNLQSTNKYSQ